jgi:hypothetical protein
VADRSFHARHPFAIPFTIPFTIIVTSIPGPGRARNEAENTKTVSNRRKISYIWGLPPLE